MLQHLFFAKGVKKSVIAQFMEFDRLRTRKAPAELAPNTSGLVSCVLSTRQAVEYHDIKKRHVRNS